MFYEITEGAILPPPPRKENGRIARKLQAHRDRRRRELVECLSVPDMQAHLERASRSKKDRPYGVEVWVRDCTTRDKFGEWEQVKIPTVAVVLPIGVSDREILRLNPLIWEEQKAFLWGFRQVSPVASWCANDLLRRLRSLSAWDCVPTIPIRPKQINKAKLQNAIDWINAGQEKPFVLGRLDRDLPLSTLRHNCTPYDYEWQTGKRDRDRAKQHWNALIKAAKTI